MNRLKKKYEEVKAEIKSNPYIPIAFAAITAGLVAVYQANHTLNLLAKEKKAHTEDATFAAWVYAKAAMEGEKKIWLDGDVVYIMKEEDIPAKD